MQPHFGFVIRRLFLSQKWEGNYRSPSNNYELTSRRLHGEDKERKKYNTAYYFSSHNVHNLEKFLDDLSTLDTSINHSSLINAERKQSSIFDYPSQGTFPASFLVRVLHVIIISSFFIISEKITVMNVFQLRSYVIPTTRGTRQNTLTLNS